MGSVSRYIHKVHILEPGLFLAYDTSPAHFQLPLMQNVG